jgi:hypothetical protein
VQGGVQPATATSTTSTTITITTRPDVAAAARAVIDDPFGLLSSLDLSALDLGAGWAAPGQSSFGPAHSALALANLYPGSNGAADMTPTPTPVPGENQPLELRELCSYGEGETCAQCGGAMRRGTNNLEYICADCGLLVEGDTAEPEDDEAPRAAPNTARLRIVGPNSNQLQPDLYRSGSGNTPATQKKAIFDEYLAYRGLYIEAGGRAFPKNALELAAEFYNAVQRQCVKRSQNKKAIMAACLWRACLAISFAPSKAEVAAFMQLPNKGIARGDNFVRSLVADGKMELDINSDPCRPEITTLFAHLGFEGDQYAGLREAVHEVVQMAIRSNIGTNSILRSKVAGAAFAVHRRCKDRALVPKAMNLQEFCAKRIRKNTVERFTRELDDYHSYFEEVYRKAGLDATPARGRS